MQRGSRSVWWKRNKSSVSFVADADFLFLSTPTLSFFLLGPLSLPSTLNKKNSRARRQDSRDHAQVLRAVCETVRVVFGRFRTRKKRSRFFSFGRDRNLTSAPQKKTSKQLRHLLLRRQVGHRRRHQGPGRAQGRARCPAVPLPPLRRQGGRGGAGERETRFFPSFFRFFSFEFLTNPLIKHQQGFWNCPCVPMRERKECHCMLFLTEDNDFRGEDAEITLEEVIEATEGMSGTS